MGNSFPPMGQNPTASSLLLESQPDYQIYQSPSGDEYQRYEIPHDNSEHFQSLYRFRIEHPHADLVQLIFAGPLIGVLACTHRPVLQIVTERIPYNLQSLSGLHPKNSLAILRTALRGFRDIYRRHGPIGINGEMIGTFPPMVGVNSKNRVKVWLNRNYAINTPEPPPASSLSLPLPEQEREMFLGVFDLVDAKTDHDGLWMELVKLKQGKNPCTFDEGLNLVDYFSGMQGVNIGETVNNLFNKRGYMPGGGHVGNVEKIKDPQNQNHSQQQQVVMRRPFEEIQSQTIRTESVSIPVHPLSHLPPQRQIVIPSANKPSIRFNITTSPTNTVILPREAPSTQQITQNVHPQPQPYFHQNSFTNTALPPPQMIITSSGPDHQQINTYHQVERSNQPPSYKAIPVNQPPPSQTIPQAQQTAPPMVSPQEQHPQSHLPQPQQPSTEQAQIQLDQTPSLEQHYQHLQVQQYQVNIHEVTSQESLHEQLATLVEDYAPPSHLNQPEEEEMHHVEEQEERPPYKIVLTINQQSHQEPSIRNLQSLKEVINPSLVDTREIKRQSTQSLALEDAGSARSIRSQKQGSISYREMRRLLLEELSN